IRPSDQPLYLSRRMTSASARRPAGELEFEAFLRANKVMVHYPDVTPLPDQIRIMCSHTTIFGPIASSAHMTLFSPHQPSLHLFSSTTINPNYILCAEAAKTPTTYINCTGEPTDPDADGPVIRFDAHRAARYLQDLGIVWGVNRLGLPPDRGAPSGTP
ncbi:MAG: hypothetical protein ACR2J8_02995, partial [Thermomicrobiales bacterium]